MPFNKDIHHRKSIRLRAYDYSQPGAYFITICTHQRQPLFGNIVDGRMMLNAAGLMAEKCWQEIPRHYPSIELGEHVVMPNHFHGIIHISEQPVGAIHESPLQIPSPRNEIYRRRTMLLSKSIGRFKMVTAKTINQLNNTTGQPLWQRNYYEHIIRNEQAYQNIAEYICTNPQRWHDDTYYVPVR
jgi:putative transposase